ncbi:PREDICTED: putative uncharacterized protein FLJ37770 [Trachymyrmex septentrionalis]|uniref:putative uncharacterized protein FLJ37770 n=1 Tax=Trachymyrmex septentrionalis TaxID=34720 RepID=UPI00084EE5E0|nr:PREDICTED: putative uncharacterized protein FLJ37770 [Trachymyrmex septentrionalis]
MLQKCFGESTLSRTQVFEWHKAFSEGREVVENLSHASRPSTSVNDDNMEKVKEIVLENRRVGIREIAEALNISYGSTQHILVNVLGMKRIAARLVPKDLNKSHRSATRPFNQRLAIWILSNFFERKRSIGHLTPPIAVMCNMHDVYTPPFVEE